MRGAGSWSRSLTRRSSGGDVPYIEAPTARVNAAHRRSRGGDVPHIEALSARVNAGYNAVIRGSDVKVSSCHGGHDVQNFTAVCNEQAKVSLGGESTLMEEEDQPTLEALEARGMEDCGGCLVRTAGFSCRWRLQNMEIGHEIEANVEPVCCDLLPPPSLSHPSAFMAAEGTINDEDMVGPSSIKPCTTAACRNDSKKNLSTVAEISTWSKPGVTPLFSLKELPHLAPKESVVQLDEQ